MGVHNFWRAVIVRGCLIGLASVQCLDRGVRIQKRFESGRRRSCRPCSCAGVHKTRAEFDLAARLLRLLLHHLETLTESELGNAELSSMRRALEELQQVATRLRREINSLVPTFNTASPVLEAETRTERMVRSVLGHLHRNYSRPLTLRQCADQVHLNPSYVSSQFSRTVGITFKAYLTDLRIEKARELLGEPTLTIAEVAYAVGYISENRFRLAFKSLTGLCPRAWRETLRMKPHTPA